MSETLVSVGSAEELRSALRRVVTVGRTPVLVLWDGTAFRAIDNRCPHMGFPLAKGTLANGLLDCHWHHARFDVTCGATLDPWADDSDGYEVIVRDGEVFVNSRRPTRDPRTHGLARLGRGLADDLRLVIAKAVIELDEGGVAPREAIRAAALFGAAEREDGWQPGLSVLAAMANVLPLLAPEDRRRALIHAVTRIADDCAGKPPRRPLPPLAGTRRDAGGLASWFRETIEVRDTEGAERVLRTLAGVHGPAAALDAVYAAATDHRYADTGHALDYAVKCAELLDHTASAIDAGLVVSSLVPQLAKAERMEETAAWRRPVDVAALVEAAWSDVPPQSFGEGTGEAPLADEDAVVQVLLDENPAASLATLVRRLREGTSPVALAESVVVAATLRVLRFGTANETPDWDTVHHTLTYANAVAEAMRRAPSRELFRAVLDGAMSVYLDRFLNVPAAPLPAAPVGTSSADVILEELLCAFDRRGGMDECATLAWHALDAGAPPERLFATLAHAALREDAGFHPLQQLDVASRRLQRRGPGRTTRLALVAAARWLASQFPTRRAAEQTYRIASRLHRGEPFAE
jgi:nitrite reductase/ring-hydroxylating ferredoxin subunit